MPESSGRSLGGQRAREAPRAQERVATLGIERARGDGRDRARLPSRGLAGPMPRGTTRSSDNRHRRGSRCRGASGARWPAACPRLFRDGIFHLIEAKRTFLPDPLLRWSPSSSQAAKAPALDRPHLLRMVDRRASLRPARGHMTSSERCRQAIDGPDRTGNIISAACAPVDELRRATALDLALPPGLASPMPTSHHPMPRRPRSSSRCGHAASGGSSAGPRVLGRGSDGRVPSSGVRG
jgi:hypothetical protein